MFVCQLLGVAIFCSLIFGIITCVTGVLGVGSGVEISRRLQRSNPRADPLVCAAGLLGSAPFLFLAVVSAQGSIVATYVSLRCSSGFPGPCSAAFGTERGWRNLFLLFRFSSSSARPSFPSTGPLLPTSFW